MIKARVNAVNRYCEGILFDPKSSDRNFQSGGIPLVRVESPPKSSAAVPHGRCLHQLRPGR